jgi:hypothetical protein
MMVRAGHLLHALTACLSGICGIVAAPLPAFVLLLASQTALLPAAALSTWLPTTQRETEGESSAPEQSSKATDPHTLVASPSARARRVRADRLARLADHLLQIQRCRALADFGRQSAEFSRRNGRGCALRC